MSPRKSLYGKIKEYWTLLGENIYSGRRLERNLMIDGWIGLIIAIVGTGMSILNIVQHKGMVSLSTILIAICGIAIFVLTWFCKKRQAAIWVASFFCMVIFTWYAVTGVNEGFAILWTLLVPLAISYFASVRQGIIISVYYELLFIVLFYTPLRIHFGQFYTETFMYRFPVLYLCGMVLNTIAMVQYHVTSLKQISYEKKLEEAAKTAISADLAKSRFLAQMSHEIRTPINAVLGMNEMILREAKDDTILEYAHNIDDAGDTLLTLINSILDFSKIEDGKMELVPVEYDTAVLVHELIISIEARARSKELEFQADIDTELPSMLYGDDVRITQVIMNLLTNAVKYTDEGKVVLSVKKGTEEDGQVELLVSVSDTGAGIREEDKEKLFKSFERLEEAKNRHIEGTGLGMSIVTKLLEMMGSRLELESVYGKGSTFSFRLLQKVVDPTPLGDYRDRIEKINANKTKDELFRAPSAKVLVVDDNGMNLKVAKNLLKLFGIMPDTAVSGKETLEKMAVSSYDIVFLDHMMPVMDGLETLKLLKEKSLVPAGTTMIVLTANAVVGAREKYLKAGFEDYLSKPIVLAELAEKLRTYLPAELLEKAGDTAEAVASEAAAAGDEPEIMEFGTDDILEFFPDDPYTEGRPGYDPERPEKEGCNTEGGPGYDLERLQKEGFNTAAGLEYCGGDRVFYEEMLSDYQKEYEHKSAELSRLIEEKDLKQYETLVHALKTTSRTIGAEDMAALALQLETAAGDNNEALLAAEHPKLMKLYKETADKLR